MFNKETGKIIRYCRPSQVDEYGVIATAFYLRKKNIELNRPEDEKTLSVDDYDFFSTDKFENIKKSLKARMPTEKENGYFALVDYNGCEKEIKKLTDIQIDIEQDINSSHCNITNLYNHDEIAAIGFLHNIIKIKQLKDIKTV